MILRQFTLSILILSAGIRSDAQTLHRSEALATALQNNSDLAIARNTTLQAAAQYHQTDAAFLPQLGVTYTAYTSNNPLNAFAFKLQQQNITQNDFNPALLNNPDRTSNFTTQATIQQPILNLDAFYQRKAARTAIEIAELQHERLQDYIRFRTAGAYLQLQLAYEVVKVLQQASRTSDSVYAFTKARYEQGFLQKSDLLNAEVHLKSVQSQLANAQSAIQDQSDNLSLLMRTAPGKVYEVDTLTPESIVTEENIPESRPDLRAMQQAIKAQELIVKSTGLGLVPRLNGFGNMQLNDRTATGFSNGSYLLGLQLSWNFFQGNAVHSQVNKQQLQKARIELQLQQMKEESEKELQTTKRRIADAAFQIAQTKTAVEQATEALQIIHNRYKQGLAGSTDVLMAQTQLFQQQLSYRQAIMMLNMSIAYCNFLTAN